MPTSQIIGIIGLIVFALLVLGAVSVASCWPFHSGRTLIKESAKMFGMILAIIVGPVAAFMLFFFLLSLALGGSF